MTNKDSWDHTVLLSVLIWPIQGLNSEPLPRATTTLPPCNLIGFGCIVRTWLIHRKFLCPSFMIVCYSRKASVQMLIYGRPMNSTTRYRLLAHLITFASLYSHNLLSLHDTDFFQTGEFNLARRFVMLFVAVLRRRFITVVSRLQHDHIGLLHTCCA